MDVDKKSVLMEMHSCLLPSLIRIQNPLKGAFVTVLKPEAHEKDIQHI